MSNTINGKSIFFNAHLGSYRESLKALEEKEFTIDDLFSGVFFGDTSLLSSIRLYAKKGEEYFNGVKVYCKLPCVYVVDKTEAFLLINSSIESLGICNVCWFHYKDTTNELRGMSYNPTVPTDYIHCIVYKGVLYRVYDLDDTFRIEKADIKYSENYSLTKLFHIVPSN